MMKFSEDEFLCTNQDCRYRPFINNWDQLLQHTKERHQVVLKDEFIMELQNIYKGRFEQQNQLIYKLSQRFEFEINDWFENRVNELKQLREILISQIEKKINEFITDNINQVNSFYEFNFKEIQNSNNQSKIVDNLLPLYHQKQIYKFENFNFKCNELFEDFHNIMKLLSQTINNQHETNQNYLNNQFNNNKENCQYSKTKANRINSIQFNANQNITNSLPKEQVKLSNNEKQYQQPQISQQQEKSIQQIPIEKIQINSQNTNCSLKGYKQKQQIINSEESTMSDRNKIVEQVEQQIKKFEKIQKIKKEPLEISQNIGKALECLQNNQKKKSKIIIKPQQDQNFKFSDYSLEMNSHKQDHQNINKSFSKFYLSTEPQTIILMPIIRRLDNFTMSMEFTIQQPIYSFSIGILDMNDCNISLMKQQQKPNITWIDQTGKIFIKGKNKKKYFITKPVNEISLISINQGLFYKSKKSQRQIKNLMENNNNYRIFIYFHNITFRYQFQ